MNIEPITITAGNTPIKVTSLHLVLTDNGLLKNVTCQIILNSTINERSRPWPMIRFKPVLLWSKEEYDAAGDWTQAQAESRLLELLGDDIKAGLIKLAMMGPPLK